MISVFVRTISLPVLAGALAAGVLSAPAGAAPRSQYAATLAQPLATASKQIIDGVMWRCEGDTCVAPVTGSRAVVTCRRVADTFGNVAGFSWSQGALTAEEIARCNQG